MPDLKSVNHEAADRLKRAKDKDKLAHAYLLVTGDKAQALNTVYWLICYANCQGENKPDGTCVSCQRILSGNYPDVFLVKPEAGRQTTSIDQIRPLKEELAKSPAEGDFRYFIIDQAQSLTLSASNALLNLLEEPVAPVVTFLIANNAGQVLPTIRSRTQIIAFEPKAASGRDGFLLENGFSQEELTQLGKTDQFDQQVKYFYQELKDQDALAIISAHRLGEQVKKGGKPMEKYLWLLLKKWAERDLENGELTLAAAILSDLLTVDQMRQSNVSVLNCLDFLALKWQK